MKKWYAVQEGIEIDGIIQWDTDAGYGSDNYNIALEMAQSCEAPVQIATFING